LLQDCHPIFLGALVERLAQNLLEEFKFTLGPRDSILPKVAFR
jgi:hypothetical protein